jgi:hypothetical protein
MGKASTYQSNLLEEFDTATDSILSDVGKIEFAWQRAHDTNSGWQIESLGKGDQIAAALTAGARISIWSQVLPMKYGLRVAAPVDTTNPSVLGSLVPSDGPFSNGTCVSEYHDVPATSMTVYPDPGDQSKWDMTILAEGPTWNSQKAQDYAISQDLSTMLTTNQIVPSLSENDQAGLNIPPLLLIDDGPFTYSTYSMATPSSPCHSK